jgi:hypothetical protein
VRGVEKTRLFFNQQNVSSSSSDASIHREEKVRVVEECPHSRATPLRLGSANFMAWGSAYANVRPTFSLLGVAA